jgi:unsaturated chondroitin disaccharide hydrolase
MLRIARLEGGEEGAEFHSSALALLNSLIAHCFETRPEAQGLLRHGALHVPKGWGVDGYLIFGDYFFLEALLALEGNVPDFWSMFPTSPILP